MAAPKRDMAIRPEGSERALPPSLWAALASMVRGRQKMTFLALIERETLSWADIEAIWDQHGWAWSAGRGNSVVQEIRRRVRGTGWHIARLPDGVALREGTAPGPSRSPGLAPETHRITRAAPFQARPANPSGVCQYRVVIDGRAVPCGAPAKGTYCDRHRAKSAGVPWRGE